jgi:hypothetical protein
MQSGEGGVNQYGPFLRLLTAPISLWFFRVPVNGIVRLAYLTNSSPVPRAFLLDFGLVIGGFPSGSVFEAEIKQKTE